MGLAIHELGERRTGFGLNSFVLIHIVISLNALARFELCLCSVRVASVIEVHYDLSRVFLSMSRYESVEKSEKVWIG